MTVSGRVKQSIFVEVVGQVYRPTDFIRGEFDALPESTAVPSTVMEQ
jgi:hypothetical protein